MSAVNSAAPMKPPVPGEYLVLVIQALGLLLILVVIYQATTLTRTIKALPRPAAHSAPSPVSPKKYHYKATFAAVPDPIE